METLFNDLTSNFRDKIIDYLPSLAAGILLLLVGWLVGWFVKRVIVRICVLLRLDRVFMRFRWGEDLSKADVRNGLYNFIGNIGYLAVFLVFTNVALSAMGMVVLSDFLREVVVFLPRFVVALAILGLGIMLASWVHRSLGRELAREDVPRAGLISRLAKIVVQLFFSAMALTELGIAREVVIIGFTTIIITLGALAVVIAAKGGNLLVEKLLAESDEE